MSTVLIIRGLPSVCDGIQTVLTSFFIGRHEFAKARTEVIEFEGTSFQEVKKSRTRKCQMCEVQVGNFLFLGVEGSVVLGDGAREML